MNRSVQRREFGTRWTMRGTVGVGCFLHPTRGLVRSPATPLIAATLRDLGYPVQQPGRPFVARTGSAEGILLTASYVDRTGQVIGFAVAAHQADRDAISAARYAITTWSALWRTRRIVLAIGSDATHAQGCLHGALSRAEARYFEDQDEEVILVDSRAASTGPPTPVAGRTVVTSAEDVAGLGDRPTRLAYVIQPGAVIEEAVRIAELLRDRYPGIRGAHPHGYCYAASDWKETIRTVASTCDTMLVLGSPDTMDVRDALRFAAEAGVSAELVAGPERIRPDWLDGAESIGLAVTDTAPPDLLPNVIGVLTGLGPASVVRRRMMSETVDPATFPAGTTAERSATACADSGSAAQQFLDSRQLPVRQ
ncbi:hypothetical protein [Amycolatopsis aidingensis]|uniref:hypothetical protein n=1 Tax=Amycolatopsis aidingensis TaxID=2842453 RepID=UPI001C0E5ADA|nr:hypothetical protein [Amycolatopsis aidingensis]